MGTFWIGLQRRNPGRVPGTHRVDLHQPLVAEPIGRRDRTPAPATRPTTSAPTTGTANIKIALTRLQKQTERFLRDTDRMFSNSYNIPKEIPWTFQGDLTEETRDQVTRNIELLEVVARHAQSHAVELQDGLQVIERVLQNRSASGNGPGVIEEPES